MSPFEVCELAGRVWKLKRGKGRGEEVKPWEKNGTPWSLLGPTASYTGHRESPARQAASHARGCPAHPP